MASPNLDYWFGRPSLSFIVGDETQEAVFFPVDSKSNLLEAKPKR